MGWRIQSDSEIEQMPDLAPLVPIQDVVSCIRRPGFGYNGGNMRKQLVLCLLIFSAVSALYAGEPTHLHSVTFLGFDPVTRYEKEVLNPGISLGQEFYASFNETIYAGAGFRYLFAREVDDDGQLTWEPVYAALKLRIPGMDLPFFIKGALGGCFVQTNHSYRSGKEKIRGGIYYFAGAGIDLPFFYTDTIRFSFVFDMGYASYNGSYETDSGKNKNFEYTTLDMLAGLGIRF